MQDIVKGGFTMKKAISIILIALSMISISMLDSERAIIPGIISLICMVTLLAMDKTEGKRRG